MTYESFSFQMLLQIADDFIDNVVTASCQLAKHRKANTVDVKDVQLHLGNYLSFIFHGVFMATGHNFTSMEFI